MTCTENDNCLLYTLETTLDPLAEISILANTENLTTTNRYFVQRVSQDQRQREVPPQFRDLAGGRKIHQVHRMEISQIEFSQLVVSAQTQ